MKTNTAIKTPVRFSLLGIAALTFTLGLPALAGQTNSAMEETMTREQNASVAPTSTPIHRRGYEQRSMTVFFGDLNLDRAAGVNTLYARLENAADRVCAPRSERNLALQRDREACYGEALDSAVDAIGLQNLDQLHFASTGRAASAADHIAER